MHILRLLESFASTYNWKVNKDCKSTMGPWPETEKLHTVQCKQYGNHPTTFRLLLHLHSIVDSTSSQQFILHH